MKSCLNGLATGLMTIVFCWAEANPSKRTPPPPRPGVTDSSLKLPIRFIKPEATFPVEGTPDWLAVDKDAVWVSNKPKDSVAKLDIKTNRVIETVTVGKKPCSGLAIGFGSVWVPNCGDNTISRVDTKTNKVVATIPTPIANTEGGIATTEDSVWLVTDAKSTLIRIDPDTNQIVAEILVAPGSVAVQSGLGGVWVTSPEKNLVTHVDPRTNLVIASIPTGPQPRFLTVGEGAVWALNQGDGTISRIDPKTDQVVATISAGLAGPGGDIAAGEGFVWATVFSVPVTRIDPLSNKVVQQFVGEGGDAIRVGHGSVWLSNLRAGNVWRFKPETVDREKEPADDKKASDSANQPSQ